MKATADPIAQLMQEHDDALLQLKVLSRAVTIFAEDGFSSKYFSQIKGAMKFIEEEVSVHNHKEEAALFPILERYVEGPTRMMRNDHKKLKKGFHQLRDAIRKIERNHDSFAAIKQLKVIAKSVVQLFVSHIHKENYILFPLVQQFLSKDELREVARKML